MGPYRATWRFFLTAYSLNVIQDLFSVVHQFVRAGQVVYGVGWRPCAVVRFYMALSFRKLLPIACMRPCCSQDIALFYLHSWLNDHADVICCKSKVILKTLFKRVSTNQIFDPWNRTFGGSHDKRISEAYPKDHANVDPLLIGLVFQTKAKNVKCQSYGAIKKEAQSVFVVSHPFYQLTCRFAERRADGRFVEKNHTKDVSDNLSIVSPSYRLWEVANSTKRKRPR